MLLEVGRLDERRRDWVGIYEALQDRSTVVKLAKPLFKLKKRVPGVLCWLPSHPVLENLPRPLGLPQHLLHERILVPELVDSGQVFAGAFPDIPCRIHKFVSHFHLRILEPESHMLKIDRYRSLKNRAGPSELSNTGFPLGVFEPRPHVMFLHAERVFKVLPHAVLIVIKLVWVRDAHLGGLVLVKLVLNRLSDQLLGGHLDLGGRVVFNARHFHHATLLLDHISLT